MRDTVANAAEFSACTHRCLTLFYGITTRLAESEALQADPDENSALVCLPGLRLTFDVHGYGLQGTVLVFLNLSIALMPLVEFSFINSNFLASCRRNIMNWLPCFERMHATAQPENDSPLPASSADVIPSHTERETSLQGIELQGWR